jgi:transposase
MEIATTMTRDPEVTAKAVRRQFTAAYKRRVLEEADPCGPGGIAALLRREGLYSSHLNTWRQQREAGEIAGWEPRKRGKKPVPRNPLAGECERLQRENARLQKRLKQAETILDVQRKLCEMLGLGYNAIPANGEQCLNRLSHPWGTPQAKASRTQQGKPLPRLRLIGVCAMKE